MSCLTLNVMMHYEVSSRHKISVVVPEQVLNML